MFRSACANDLAKSLFFNRNRSLKLQLCIDFDAYFNYMDERTYDTLGDICLIFERPEHCVKATVTILVW